MHKRFLVALVTLSIGLASALPPAPASAQSPPYRGTWGTNGSGDGQFNNPGGVAVDAAGNIYVTDVGNYRIQKFTSVGAYVTQWGSYGSGNGQFNEPWGVAVDGSGNVYVADTFNHRIQKFSSSGAYLTQWGTAGVGEGQFDSPFGVAVDGSSGIYVTDRNNHRVQKFGSLPMPTKSTSWGRIKALYR